jgi:hypothetical protein
LGILFTNLATFNRLIKEIAKMAIPWAENLLHFHRNKVLKNMFCFLATVLATLKKIGGIFSNHLVTLRDNEERGS